MQSLTLYVGNKDLKLIAEHCFRIQKI